MRSGIEAWLLKQLSNRMSRQANSVELMPKYSLGKHVGLDSSEIEAIERVWKKLSPKLDFRYWMLYKAMFSFSPLLTPDDIYVRSMVRVLNPMRKCYCLQNKNMYPILYKGMRMPTTIINNIDGQAYGSDNKTIGMARIFNHLRSEAAGSQVILKPSTDSCSGNGVQILDLQDESDCKRRIQSAGRNFVIQEVLTQSETTRRFNSSSLNTFRVNTLYLNGLITVENIMFRHGRGKSPVDNAGAGGVCVGFNPDGKTVGKAIDAKLNEYDLTPFGEHYKNLYIPELTEICRVATDAHISFMPMMGHVAWDFALDEKNQPVLIEVNLGWPGVMTEQLSSCRPVFGDRTSEVIEYVQNNRHKMSFTDFLGHWT